MSMVERVALALLNDDRTRNGLHAVDALSYLRDEDAAAYRRSSRAAIEAMREPAPGMIRKAEGYSDFMLPNGTHDNTVEGRRAEMRMAYQCAIDAALAEAGEGR